MPNKLFFAGLATLAPGVTRGGAVRKSGWRIGRFCARVGAGVAGPGVLVAGNTRLRTASNACRMAGGRSGFGVGSLAGHMVGNWLQIDCNGLEQSQLGHGNCLVTCHYKVVKHTHVDQGERSFQRLGQCFVCA